MINVAVFASGAGSNAARIIGHFSGHATIRISLVVTNNPAAGVVAVAKAGNIPVLYLSKEPFFKGNAYLEELMAADIQWIVLAGFLWKVPKLLVKHYAGRIINIHPALLPKYGGKGMYGRHVHEAVLAAGDDASGITIHFVDEHYDHGEAIFQATCPVYTSDTPESLAQRIHELEHLHFAPTIEDVILRPR